MRLAFQQLEMSKRAQCRGWPPSGRADWHLTDAILPAHHYCWRTQTKRCTTFLYSHCIQMTTFITSGGQACGIFTTIEQILCTNDSMKQDLGDKQFACSHYKWKCHIVSENALFYIYLYTLIHPSIHPRAIYIGWNVSLFIIGTANRFFCLANVSEMGLLFWLHWKFQHLSNLSLLIGFGQERSVFGHGRGQNVPSNFKYLISN